MGRHETFTDAQLLGIQEVRACTTPDPQLSRDGITLVPFVDFDPNNPRTLPCNAVVPECGGVSLELPVPRVSPRGCFVQRQAGLCPRGLALTPTEINALSVQNPA